MGRLTARCALCEATFDCRDQVPGAPPAPPRAPRARAPQPEEITVVAPAAPPRAGMYRDATGAPPFALVQRSAPENRNTLAAMAAVWDAFVVVGYILAIQHGTGIGALLLPLLPAAVGVVITYAAICNFVNTTEVTIQNDTLRVDHKPLPLQRSCALSVATIAQLYCLEKGDEMKSYTLMAILKSGRRVAILSGLEADHALYFEQCIEEQLDIHDARVVGEYSGPAQR